MKKLNSLIMCLFFCAAGQGLAYPLDGFEESGIRRLLGYQQAQAAASGPRLAPGQLLNVDAVRLRLLNHAGPDFDQVPEDPELAAFLAQTLLHRDPSYAMVLVDLTDSGAWRWAGLRPDLKQNPGSVGKLVTMVGVFHALKQAFPDVDERARILRTATSSAGDWVSIEQHRVPKWNASAQRNEFSVIVPGDEFRLSEWLDHAISVSANGAGAVAWREAILLSHFGARYPASAADNERFFAETPGHVLSAIARALVTEPLKAAAIDTRNLQQGSLWTADAKRKVPGIESFATARELARLLFRMEQGRLVDEWSSLQMKKYLYLTKRRYRYSYPPELATSAVYFKSGSLYSCRAEEGFRCGKYMGNVRNMMNSTAIVEGPGESGIHYIATLMSNVLKFNSAWDHARIGAAVHETLRTRTRQVLPENASARTMQEAGQSD